MQFQHTHTYILFQKEYWIKIAKILLKKILVQKEINWNQFLRTEFVFKKIKINFIEDNLNMLLSIGIIQMKK